MRSESTTFAPSLPALPGSHHNGTGTVDQVAPGLGGSVDRVDSTEQQFLLKVGTAQDILLILSRNQEWRLQNAA